MTTSYRILAISGSIRSESSNAALLRAAAGLAPSGFEFVFFDQQLAAFPAFTPDLDEEGMAPPAPVAELRALLASAAGVLISCPEYAYGVPGAFKNALDWVVSSGSFSGKPVALLTASPSGAPNARAALLPTLKAIEARVVFEDSVRFTRRQLVDGRITDPTVEEQVRAALVALNAALGGS